jgi:hypothetical protein
VVVAEDAATAGEGVFVEFAGPLEFAQRAEVGGEIAGGKERVGVVVAECATAGEGVFVEFAGPLEFAQRAQDGG